MEGLVNPPLAMMQAASQQPTAGILIVDTDLKCAVSTHSLCKLCGHNSWEREKCFASPLLKKGNCFPPQT